MAGQLYYGFWRTRAKWKPWGSAIITSKILINMGNKESYDQMLEEAKTLAPDQIQTPYMPVGIYIQEAEDLNKWALKDKDKLTATGLPETIFNQLETCAGALREAQSIWAEELKSKQEAEEKWSLESPNAFEFRNELLHTFRYAYRKQPSLLTNVAAIAEGNDIPDMIQDLNDLAVLGRNNLELLGNIGFQEEKLATASELSAYLADLRAEVNGDKYNNNEDMEIRNSMYTLLKECVDEIRACGKFVFWKDPKRIIGYRSQYNRNINKKN